MNPRSLILLALASVSPTQGPVTMSALTVSPLQLSAGPYSRSIPASTDVSPGYSLSLAGIGNYVPAFAEASLASSYAPKEIAWTLKATALGGVIHMGTDEVATVGPQTVEFTFRSPTPARVYLDVVYTGCAIGVAKSQLDVAVLGVGSFTYIGTCPTTPLTKRWLLWLDPTGIKVRVQQWTNASGGAGGQSTGTSECALKLSADPSYPYSITDYGSECNLLGDTVSNQVDLRGPGTLRVVYDSNSAGNQAFVVIGDQSVNLQLTPSCFLYNNALIVLPMTNVTSYERECRLPALPSAGAHAYLQVVSSKPLVAIQMSRGFDLLAN